MLAVSDFDATAWPRLVRFAKSPKGLLIAILAAFAVMAAAFLGVASTLPNVVVCVTVAVLLDVAIAAMKHDRLRLPDGAILTGLIVALVLRPEEPLATAAAVTAIAIGAKHALRTRWSNVFNPAALALVAGALIFQARESWWGALPDAGVLGTLPLVVAGAFMADRINKLPLVAAFLATYFGLFTADSFLGTPAAVSEVFRTPDIQAVLFFAFFMLDDPPTCPIRYEDQAVFAVIVAAGSFVVFKLFGVDYYLAAALLAGNGWESARRVWMHRRARATALAPAPIGRSGWAPRPSARGDVFSDSGRATITESRSTWRRPS